MLIGASINTPPEVAFRPRQRRTVVVARTDNRVRSFGPYAAAVRDDGAVLYAAEHQDGSTAVHIAAGNDRDPPVEVRPPAAMVVVSHPDAHDPGSLCFYARSPDGSIGLWRVGSDGATSLASHCGPLGPTMGAGGHVAYRTDGAEGQGVWLWDGLTSHRLDHTDERVAGFEGLPVAAGGRVVWRATRRDGSHEIRLWTAEGRATLAATGNEHASLARFPMLDAAGRVVFGSTSRAGADSLHLWDRGRTTRVTISDRHLASIRGGLISDRGTLLVIGTPRDGRLGVFDDEMGEHPVMQLGSSLDGSRVAEFAVNPVSINAIDHVAIRATLEDGRQVIARSDPGGAWAP